MALRWCAASLTADGCAARSSPLAPVPRAIEIEVDDRSGIERQDLAYDQPAEDGDAQRLAELAALAEADHQWHRAEQRGHGGHHDGPKAHHTGFEDGLTRRHPAQPFGVEREV